MMDFKRNVETKQKWQEGIMKNNHLNVYRKWFVICNKILVLT